MASSVRDIFVVGLRNAHAMEVQAREMMERQAERLGDYPEVQAKVQAHLAETNNQLGRLETCLESCGERSSTLKDTAQAMMANTTAMAHAMAGDEILKNTFANHAFENFEIAAYKSLLAMCEEEELGSMREPLQASLAEEERMAQWIKDNVESVTRQYLAHERAAA